MKTLGMIGGVGPESTVDYYKNIIATFRERQPNGHYPQFVINSIDLQKGIDFLEANDLPGMTEFLLREIGKLPRAGAEFGIIAANTPHIVFDEVAARSAIPLISIVEAACAYAKVRNFKRLALFGTRYTMKADFYQKVFRREGIELIVPETKDQDYIHEKYFAELVPGNFLPETRAGLLAIVDRMKSKIGPPSSAATSARSYSAAVGIEGVVLAGTELALILRGESHNGVALLDTGKIHCQAAVDAMFY
jgi:aspartate racemase